VNHTMARSNVNRITVCFALVALVLGGILPARAGSVGEILESLMKAGRRTGKAASEGKILRHVEDLPVTHLPKQSEAEILRRFERFENVDDTLRREFRELPLQKRILVVELGEASKKIMSSHQNGEEIIRKLDGEGLWQARTYGDFVADGVQLVGPEYKDVVRKTGSGAAEFFSKYLKPHYKELAAAGLVSAYVVAPERFHDAAGHLTESATRELTRLGIEVGGAASRGFWNGIRSKVDESPVFSLFGIVAILTCLALTLPRVRWHLFRAIRPLFTAPTTDSSNAEFRSSPTRRFEE